MKTPLPFLLALTFLFLFSGALNWRTIMFRIIFISVVILFVGGCATVKETYSQDGSKAYTLNCSGLARGWDKCYSSAGDLCGTKGYNIIEKSSEDMTAIGGNAYSFSGAKTNERSMLISCKE